MVDPAKTAHTNFEQPRGKDGRPGSQDFVYRGEDQKHGSNTDECDCFDRRPFKVNQLVDRIT